MTLKRRITVVVVDDNGVEREITAGDPGKEKPKMAQPSTSRLPLVRTRVEHLMARVERAYDLCAHWDTTLQKALDAAGEQVDIAQRFLAEFPEGFVPPRKPPARKYIHLRAGDLVRVADRSAKKVFPSLVGKTFKIESISDGWAWVRVDGIEQQRQVELKHLVVAKS